MKYLVYLMKVHFWRIFLGESQYEIFRVVSGIPNKTTYSLGYTPVYSADITHRIQLYSYTNVISRHVFVSIHKKCKFVLKADRSFSNDRVRHRIASNKFSSLDYWRFCKIVLAKINTSISPSSINLNYFYPLSNMRMLYSQILFGFYSRLILDFNLELTLHLE